MLGATSSSSKSLDGGDGGGRRRQRRRLRERRALLRASSTATIPAQNSSKGSKRKSRTTSTSSGAGLGSGSRASGSKIVIELYDLSIDPAESVNLATKRADKLKELQAIASKYLTDSVAPLADISVSPEAAPVTAPGWKYPRIVGLFGEPGPAARWNRRRPRKRIGDDAMKTLLLASGLRVFTSAAERQSSRT